MSRQRLRMIRPLFIAIATLLLPGLAEAAARVALVIGNDQYVNSPKLTNAANDARGIAEALRGDLGFTLVGGGAQIDRSRGQALELLEQFRRESTGAEIALFYFAGHGVAEAGENWLMPSDDRSIAFREDVPLHALQQQAVLERMKGRVNVMVLDACRNNPLPSREGGRDATRGLQPKGGPRGTLVAYSAGVGEVASDGASYTRELLKRIRTPGLRLDDLFRMVGDSVYFASNQRQNPAIQDQLRDGAVYLLPALGVVVPPPAPTPPLDMERLAYEAAQASNTAASWQAYLNRYPNGVYAGVADVQLAALSRPAPVQSPSPTPSPSPALPQPSSSPEPASRDCADCPEMVRIPGGRFRMGNSFQKPEHDVSIRPFSVGKHEVTFAEWDACVSVGGCSEKSSDQGWGRGNRPVINVSWEDAQQYVKWLSWKTGKRYRLLTESEWEYVARAGKETEYSFGNSITSRQARFLSNKSAEVGSYAANAWGLHDMHGNVSEWTEDCWHNSYSGAPTDGSAWIREGNCDRRVLRGGSWNDNPVYLSSTSRLGGGAAFRYGCYGFRLARTE